MFDFLSQQQGVRLPDPVAGYGKALTLANLARQNRQGAYQEAEQQRQQAAMQEANRGLAEAQTAGWDVAIQNVAQRNPDAAAMLVDFRNKAEAAKVERDNKQSQTDERRFNVKQKAYGDVGNVAFAEAQKPGPMSVSKVMQVAKFYGIDRDLAPPPEDPTQVADWLSGIGNAAVDAKTRLADDTSRRGQDMTQTTAREGHQVTARGQDITDKRAREIASMTDARARESNRIAQGQADAVMTGQPQEIQVDGRPVLAIYDRKSGTFFDANTRQPIRGGIAPKGQDLPASLVEKLAQNEVTLGKIDRALQLVDETPDAFGLKNYAGDAIMQRLQPAGVEPRALIADIAGQKIHDRSGAAVTVGEMARLKPYIPNVTDDPATVKEKLGLFRQEYARVQQEMARGRSIAEMVRSNTPTASGVTALAPPKLGEVRNGYLYNGGDPGDRNNWKKVQ